MPLFTQTLTQGEQTITVIVQHDARLKKTARWSLERGVVTLRVPARTSKTQAERLLAQITPQLFVMKKRPSTRTDAELEARAQALNKQFFDGELQWNSIRWVGNMRKRLGSCTTGGPTDGDIRISTALQAWPIYVQDYVIAHEIAHRKHPNHSVAFWTYLARYPLTERARGFIEGVGYTEDAVDEPE